MEIKKAFITGITGQDGSYLAELLLDKGYEVHGIIRRSSSFNTGRIQHILEDIHKPELRLFLHYGDMTDALSLARVIERVRPDEIYNLAAQSHVRVSFDQPILTAEIGAIGTLCLLEAIRNSSLEKSVRFYQASSSEMFGQTDQIPQNEETPFNPMSPYACAKVFSYYAVNNYRAAYGMHASNGILFNHESPRRGETFVTRKITRGLARILAGLDDKLFLGNLDAKRDWGFSGDYVEAMWLMLQQSVPDDYVIATGATHSVKEFLAEAFGAVGLDWQGYVEVDERYFRPSEVEILLGDASKARDVLKWVPRTSFEDLVRMLLRNDLDAVGLSEKYDI
jgi:GDPmannose 4,6-dehydratase